MDDLISRQAVIDALCSDCSGRCIPCESYPCGEIKVVNGVPSVQPEIIRCKDCKHGTPPMLAVVKGIYCRRCEMSHSQDWFCADGER